MDRQLERCCGLDVHKETIAACVRIGGRRGHAMQHVQTFRTTVKRLRIARSLVGFDSLLKQPGELLIEAIQGYSVRAALPSPLMRRQERRHLASNLEKIADGSSALNGVVRQIVADVKALKERFLTSTREALDEALGDLNRKFSAKELSAVPFEEFFANGALGWGEDLADHLGGPGVGDACRRRGLDGLLSVRIVRMTVGVAMSQVHSLVCGGRQP